MMTLKHFTTLLDSYGADLRRWPGNAGDEAQYLLAHSAQARARLAEARHLDTALAAAGTGADARLWPPGEMDAALARLRLGVAARIAQKAVPRRGLQAAGWDVPMRWLGMATGGGLAVTAGLLIGLTTATHSMSGAGDTVFAMLQPAPLPVLADMGGDDGTTAR